MTLKQPAAQSYSKRLEALAASGIALGFLTLLGLYGWWMA